jgi:hypothetical protein
LKVHASTTKPDATAPAMKPHRSRAAAVRVAVAELDPSDLLQLEGAECLAEPVGEPYAGSPAKRTSGR